MSLQAILSLLSSQYRNSNAVLVMAIIAMMGCDTEDARLESTLNYARATSMTDNQALSRNSNNSGTATSTGTDTAKITVAKRKTLDIERFIKLTTQWEFESSQQSLYKYPDGATISFSINGIPTDSDLKTVTSVVDELSALTQLTFIEVSDADQSSVDIYFEPVDKFPSLLSNYVPGNYGFFTTPTIGTTIVGATILINSQSTEPARKHLIREEITQSLGLFNDLPDDQTSIFYSIWNLVQDYNDSDKDIISSLYTSGLTAGMTASQIRQFFE